MSPEATVGVIVILLFGLAALLLAAVLDLRAERRAEAQLKEATTTGIDEVDQEVPDYVSEADALAEIPLRPLPDPALDRALSGATAVAARLADERSATHTPPPTAVLYGPLVLVNHEGFGSVRESLGLLERASQSQEALALVSPEFDEELLDVIAANTRRGTLDCAAIIADSAACDEIALLTGATALGRADLQSGYLPHSAYGRAALLVASATGSRWVSTSSEG